MNVATYYAYITIEIILKQLITSGRLNDFYWRPF